jgi:hypothetical protein
LFTFFFSRLIILSQIRRNLSSSTCTRALTQGLNQGFRITQIKQHNDRYNYIKPVSSMNPISSAWKTSCKVANHSWMKNQSLDEKKKSIIGQSLKKHSSENKNRQEGS